MNTFSRSKVNWKTSASGIGMILAGTGALLRAINDWTLFTPDLIITNLGLIFGGWGLLCARDAMVTSEQMGVTPSAQSVNSAKEVDSKQ